MSIHLRVTSKNKGTVSRTVQYLHGEGATGVLTVSFGRGIPSAFIYLVRGAVEAAEFGNLKGMAVFDLLVCQENSINEIQFQPGRESQKDDSLLLTYSEPASIFAEVDRAVETCGARSFIYGLFDVRLAQGTKAQPLLQILHSFELHRQNFEEIEPSPLDRKAPLPQCILLRRALDKKFISYKNPVIALRKFRALLELVQPLDEKEAENLKNYSKMLLPHSCATHMPLERFYAYASAIEAIAYKRGTECGDESRRIICQLIAEAGGDKGSDSASMPARRGPRPKPMSDEATPKPRMENPNDLDS